MSIALEKALNQMSSEGGCYRTNSDGKIVGVHPVGWKASPSLKALLVAVGNEIEEYFKQNASVMRCFRCEQSDMCQDGTACRYPPM
jgi:hypothetical protein